MSPSTGAASGEWSVSDLDAAALGSWEPSYDTELWRTSGTLSLFVQSVDQVDGEGKADVAPRPVKVLDWTPDFVR